MSLCVCRPQAPPSAVSATSQNPRRCAVSALILGGCSDRQFCSPSWFAWKSGNRRTLSPSPGRASRPLRRSRPLPARSLPFSCVAPSAPTRLARHEASPVPDHDRQQAGRSTKEGAQDARWTETRRQGGDTHGAERGPVRDGRLAHLTEKTHSAETKKASGEETNPLNLCSQPPLGAPQGTACWEGLSSTVATPRVDAVPFPCTYTFTFAHTHKKETRHQPGAPNP